ncbi:MAG TPA: agmatine deiminase family protein [archaeon]|nr:agmatine deiminase family protein [archaeon]
MPRSAKSGKVRIALVQMKMSASKLENTEKAVSMVLKAAKKGAKIVCLPELFSTLYFPQEERDAAAKTLAEKIPGETTMAMSALAKKLGIVLIVPFYEKARGGKFFNTVCVFDEKGKILGKYRKMHIPHDPFFYEKNYFREGDLGYKVFSTRYGKIAPLICFDQWFPEAARISALKGADIIFYPTAIGRISGQKEPDDWLDAWQTIQRAHAVANGIHVAAVNRVGREGKLEFWGSSFVSDSFGKVLKKAGSGEKVLVADVNLKNNERVREGWGFFRNRRPESYGVLKLGKAVKKKTENAAKITRQNKPASTGLAKKSIPPGFRFPAEWERHEAVFLAWPHDTTTFPELEKVENAYCEIIRALQETRSEQVKLFVTGKKMRARAVKLLSGKKIYPKKILFFEHGYADVWFRDYGPSFTLDKKGKKLAMVKWHYNAYGGKYKELMKDDGMPAKINSAMKIPFFDSGVVMEGGAIESNGKGTLLTTRQCLLSKTRNPELGKNGIERVLKSFLNISNIIWLGKGIKGDDTDGHIDNLARFVGENTIVCSFEEDKKDVNYGNLKENYSLLLKARNEKGKPFRVVKLPVPKYFRNGKRMPASYANFYIANKAVLVPQFGLADDFKAMKIIGKFFSGRKIIGINCREMVFGSGTLHCISQQQPKI